MKTALITGGNRGIGYEIANKLAKKNYQVFLSARNITKGIEAVKKINKRGCLVKFLHLDVADEESVKNASEDFSKTSLQLDVLVNNAAIAIDKVNVSKMDPDTFELTLRTNTIGPFLVIKKFLQFMKQGSRIINISSGAGSLNDMENYAPSYSISKAALNALTLQFAAVLKSKGIAVNSICPGWVRTEMGSSSASRAVEKGAETALWLATEASIDLTGKFLRDKKEIEW